MKRLFLIAMSLISLTTMAQDWETWYEKSDFLETANYDKTVAYCKQLAEYSSQIHYTKIGISPRNYEIPMLIVDRDGLTTPEAIREKGRAILLFEAGIHPGESEGRDAGMILLRELCIEKKNTKLLDNVSLLFIPVFNVDGDHRFTPYSRINQNGPKEMGWRSTATNLNLNRDFMKADAPEMQDWLKMFNYWLPDFFIDSHTTDGADYQYVLTFAVETGGNMDKGLTKWQEEVYLPFVSEKMFNDDMPIFPYVSFRNWHDPRSGLRESVAPPMLSQGYTAIQNRPGLLIETHMLKPYKPRVESTYAMVKYTMEIMNKECNTLCELNKKADDFCSSDLFRNEELAVRFYTSTKDSVMVDFLGVEYDIKHSDLTGGDWFVYYPDQPKTFKIPMFNTKLPAEKVKLPRAYLIPPEWIELINRLDLHGIEYERLKEDTWVEVESYKFKNYKWSPTPFEGRMMMQQFEMDTILENRLFVAGSVRVPTNQRTARVIAHILEPKAADSYLSWGFFNTTFERKEYVETYVMEPMARKMIAENPELEQEFKDWLKEHPEYKNNQWLQLFFFYEKTPYWDQQKDKYPIGRVL
jgi:murein tripeptide amidase MpaA